MLSARGRRPPTIPIRASRRTTEGGAALLWILNFSPSVRARGRILNFSSPRQCRALECISIARRLYPSGHAKIVLVLSPPYNSFLPIALYYLYRIRENPTVMFLVGSRISLRIAPDGREGMA